MPPIALHRSASTSLCSPARMRCRRCGPSTASSQVTTSSSLLLVDEAEVLADIVVNDPAWIARLRKAVQEGNQRTIVASTHLLHNLTARSLDWMTSPFLFGFNQLNLWPFDRTGAVSLVRQTQSGSEIAVEEWVLQDILQYTNQHPYLIQYLCQRLFVPTGERTGFLRPLTADDLELDRLLDAYFRTDYEQSEPLARRILLIDGGERHHHRRAGCGGHRPGARQPGGPPTAPTARTRPSAAHRRQLGDRQRVPPALASREPGRADSARRTGCRSRTGLTSKTSA